MYVFIVPCSAFDVLYVVDPCRAWYYGGDSALMQQQYMSRLEMYTKHYDMVVMIGDSMGATAALLFSPLATAVMAFCPQVRSMATACYTTCPGIRVVCHHTGWTVWCRYCQIGRRK